MNRYCLFLLTLPSILSINTEEETLDEHTKSWMTLQYDERGWYRYYIACDRSITMEYMIEAQNPRSCADVKYLLVPSHNHGHGSSLHALSHRFSGALVQNRILILMQDWIWADQNDTCTDHNLACYFAPISNCTLNYSDIQWDVAIGEDIFSNFNSSKYLKSADIPLYSTATSSLNDECDKATISSLNSMVRLDLKNMLFTGHALRFFTRLTPRTYNEVKQLLHESLVVLHPNALTPALVFENVNNPSISHPPLHSLSMHIRHGDKWKEAQLHNITEYLDAADALLQHHPLLVKHIILSTDDENVIEHLINDIPSRRGYTFYYIHRVRLDKGGNPLSTALKISGVYKATIHALLDLMLSTHPLVGGFVAFTQSNWNMMIHELASTDCVKRERAVVDLSHQVSP